MIVVLDGPDGSGKTTLAKALIAYADSRGVNARCWHSTYRGTAQFIYDVAVVRLAVKYAFLSSEMRLSILDRSWLGHDIYGRVFRPTQPVATWTRRVDSLLRAYNSLYVLASPDPDTLEVEFKRLCASRPEMYSTMRAVAEMYSYLWHGGLAPASDAMSMTYVEQESVLGWSQRDDVIRYDRFCYNGDDLKLAAELIFEKARLSRLEHQSSDFGTIMGRAARRDSSRPKPVLILSHYPLEPDSAWPLPFLSDRGQARFVARAIHRLSLSETQLVYFDAVTSDGYVRDLSMFRDRVAGIIALGPHAYSAASQQWPRLNIIEVDSPRSAQDLCMGIEWSSAIGKAIGDLRHAV